MATFTVEKVVSALPDPLSPNTMYAVRVGNGFDFYFSDSTGTVAHKVNSAEAGSVAWTDVTGKPVEFPAEAHTHLLADVTDAGSAAALNAPPGGQNADSTELVRGDDLRLTNARAPTAHVHNLGDISDWPDLFNNSGYAHNVYNDFNNTTNYGARYIKGDTNGPATAGQYYGFILGLGDGYASTAYASQIYWGRNVADPYINIRSLENGTWGAWQKAAAGKADQLKTGRTISLSGDVSGSVVFDGTANVTITATIAGLGAANGIATLDGAGTVPASQLPSFVSDVEEYADEASFPATGESGKLYIDLATGGVFRWTGSVYVQINDSVSTADEALKLTTPRNISLSGDASGSIAFDGSADVAIPVVVTDDSHGHTLDTLTDIENLFNNSDAVHGANRYFDTTDEFGPHYIKDPLDGPGGDSGFYGIDLGLGTDYAHSAYASQLYWGRYVADPYLWIRGKEGGTWGSWRKAAAGKADQLTTARTISISGDATGSVAFDGSSNADIVLAIADDSHSHVIANIDGLQTALDGKLSTSGGAVSGVVTAQRFVANLEGTPALTVEAVNTETPIFRVNADAPGSTKSNYGFSLTYMGQGSGNENNLVLRSDNQTATDQVDVFTVQQDGHITINSNTTLEGDIAVTGAFTSEVTFNDALVLADAGAIEDNLTKLYRNGNFVHHGKRALKGFIPRVVPNIDMDTTTGDNQYYELGSFAFSSMQGEMRVDFLFAGSGGGIEATFILPLSWQMDYLGDYGVSAAADTWYALTPLHETPRHYLNSATQYELLAKWNGNSIEFRARVVAATQTGGALTLYAKFQHSDEFENCTYTELTGTGTDATSYTILPQLLGGLRGETRFGNNVRMMEDLTVDGTVNGRDIAADGTKLDGIEAGADVTDTINVTAAGALMDSEVTNLAAVKAFNPTDYATAAQGALADSSVQLTGNQTIYGFKSFGQEISIPDDNEGITFAGGGRLYKKSGTGMVWKKPSGQQDPQVEEYDGSAFHTIWHEGNAPKGVANGLATLDGSGLVPASQLPSFVDDVLEYADFASLPGTGETGKIYVTLDENDQYRWSGSAYVKISDAVSSSDQATKLATARTISLSGAATGSVAFDGSANVSISVSNVNADTLDGIDSSGFVRLNATGDNDGYAYLHRNNNSYPPFYVNQLGTAPIARFLKGATTSDTDSASALDITNEGGIEADGNIVTSGNVGIGTTTPDELLEVRGGSAEVKITATGSNPGLGLYNEGVNAGTRNWDIRASTVEYGDLVFRQGATLGADPTLVRASFRQSGDFELYTNLSVSGNVTVTGTVDGRDIAADGALLDTAYSWGDHAAAGYLSATGPVFSGVMEPGMTGARVKYSTYTDPTDRYGMGMQDGFTFGHLNGWAVTFQMNNDANRGFWWGDDADGQVHGAMSLTTDGRLHVNNKITVGNTTDEVLHEGNVAANATFKQAVQDEAIALAIALG